jgi:solute carrier family 6 amino acid transporter-like protein 5/7/9/14
MPAQKFESGDGGSRKSSDENEPTLLEPLVTGNVTESTENASNLEDDDFEVDLVAKDTRLTIDVQDVEGKKLGGSRDTLGESTESLDEGERGAWGGKLEFIFTCIGYAVGLGNVWRFPYLCYKNGGGAFLVPYVIMLGLVGLPLFFMELSFGQFASLGPISIWKINPLFKGLGWAMVCVSWLIAVYYNVIISHVMMYLFASFGSIIKGLPWITCGNPWNSPECIPPKYAEDLIKGVTHNETVEGVVNATMETFGNLTSFGNFTTNETLANITGKFTPAEEYYMNYILEQSTGMEEMGPVSWKLALCLLLSWVVVLICLIRGIQSLGKVVYFTAIFPYLMLTILLIRGVSLPGAAQGIIFYLKPDFSRLGDSRVWSDAATQIFYSLSACSGGLIAMSSYNKFNNNCLRDSLIVSLINCGTSIYAGFVIFAVLGFMAMEKGVPVSEVAEGGPGLAFVVYPEAISRMPVPQLWAIFFFFMMATLGFGSQFSIVECVLSAITDEFASVLRGKWPSVIFRSVVIGFTFLLGLPMVTKGGIYLLNLVDYSVSGFPLLFVGLLELIALNWIYGYDRFAEDIKLMLGHRPNIYWKVCWMGVSPVVIIITIVFNCVSYKPPSMDLYTYPAWAQALGWLISLFPILLIPAFFLFQFCKDGGFSLLREVMKPEPDWGPALQANRKDVYSSDQQLSPSHNTKGEKNFGFDNRFKPIYLPSVSQHNLNTGIPPVYNDLTSPLPQDGPLGTIMFKRTHLDSARSETSV